MTRTAKDDILRNYSIEGVDLMLESLCSFNNKIISFWNSLRPIGLQAYTF